MTMSDIAADVDKNGMTASFGSCDGAAACSMIVSNACGVTGTCDIDTDTVDDEPGIR